MIADGADIIDIGGESTRPGAAAGERRGRARARAAARRRARQRRCRRVGRHVQARGDARGDRCRRGDDQRRQRTACDPARWKPSATTDAAVCLMHMRGEPRDDAAGAGRTATSSPRCASSCSARGSCDGRRHRARSHRRSTRASASASGWRTISRSCAALPVFAATGYPVHAWACRASRRSGDIHRSRRSTTPGRRALRPALAAVARGARILRVHDVRETVDALKVWSAIEGAA